MSVSKCAKLESFTASCLQEGASFFGLFTINDKKMFNENFNFLYFSTFTTDFTVAEVITTLDNTSISFQFNNW